MSWSERGFTQFELLMVLALVAILAAITLPRFDRIIESYKLRTDARQLAWVLRSARQEAITTGHNQLVMLKIYQHQYEMGSTTYTLSPGIRFEGTTNFKEVGRIPACGFTPSGAPTGAGTVTLKNKYDKKIEIKVNVGAGRVRIVE
ncbi:GspH/FimT family pseudopilin [Syntrophomonas curvata]